MIREPIFFVLRMKKDIWTRMVLNDLPILGGLQKGPTSMAGGANQWLLPGLNAISLEVLKAPLSTDWDLQFVLYTVKDPNAMPIDAKVLHQWEFPHVFESAAKSGRSLPYCFSASFEMDQTLYSPVYLEASQSFFDCDGTPELRQVVQSVHDALDQGNLLWFMDLYQLKYEEYERAYAGHPQSQASRHKDAMRRLFSHKLKVKPVDFSCVHFEPRANGRIAYVTGMDGRPVIEAVPLDAPAPRLQTDLLLTQTDGRWRIFA